MTLSVPVARSSYASASTDEAWDALSQMYTRARPHTASPHAAIRFEGAATPEIAVDRGWLSTASGSFDHSPDQLNIITVTSGRIGLDFGPRGSVMNAPGDSYLYLPDSSAELEWQDFGALTLRVSPRLVALSAAQQTGMAPDELHFTSPRPLSADHARLWLTTMNTLWQQLADPGCRDVQALVHRELLNVIAAAAISVFPNTAMTRGYVPGPGDVRPAALRRAVAYIDAHASLPISVTDIAEAAGPTAPALRAAFHRHLDSTPTAYLRRVRLEGAREDLQAADPSRAVVGEVAARWGFRRPDHFAALYREAFGTTPLGAPRRDASS